MSRAQEGQVVDTAKSQNQTLNANSTTAFGAVPGDIATQQGDVNNFQSQLGKFAAANPYVQGGEFQTAQNQQLADTAAGVSDATKQAVEGASVRTGANVGGAVAGAEEAAQQAQRTMGGQVAGANQERIGQEAGYNEKALGGYQVVPGMQGQVTGQQEQLANQQGDLAAGALSTDEKASEMPSWLEDENAMINKSAEGFAQGVGQGLGSICPAKGTFYRMADDTERKVETLREGEYLAGIDGDKCLIEEIQSGETATLLIQTEDGHRLVCSRVHAFAMPIGGFTVAMHSMGKTVLTATGRSKIVRVEPHGIAEVFNVITDGSHSYCADGMWSLGVGEAERHISMEKWNRIGAQMEEQAVGDGGR
jgi:hypothetical protein